MKEPLPRTQIIIAAVLFGLAIVRFTFHGFASTRMDGVFLILVGVALLLLIVPLNYLKSFKAGGVEFSLDQPQVQGAISGLSLDRIANEKIQAHLARLKDQLVTIRGSRVLWIDDYPHAVVGERRLLRALGVEVITAISSEAALQILEADNDFDLIISDVQREGESYMETGGVPIHEGVNFIIRLRTNQQDPVIAKLPVIFYAAYDWDRLVEFTQPARLLYPSSEISKSEDDLIPKVVKLLAESRSTPIHGTKEKKATPVRGSMRYVPARYAYGVPSPDVNDDDKLPAGEEEEPEDSGGEEEEHFG